MYRDTVTVFNRVHDRANGDMWYPTVLTGVDLHTDRAAIVSKYGAESGDKAILHVRYDHDIVIAGKPYLPPTAWQKGEDHAGTITFNHGQHFDFFIVGTWENEEPVRDRDYDGGFYEHLTKERDGVFAVADAALYSIIPHFEITGR